ncbi:MAG: hypothetical protein LC808_16240 [Actinobacteria bacterium]|nr:hypothetical protein [Actinomycetota bacterium]
MSTITPKMEPEDASHVTLLGEAEIEQGQVTVKESWVSPERSDMLPQRHCADQVASSGWTANRQCSHSNIVILAPAHRCQRCWPNYMPVRR